MTSGTKTLPPRHPHPERLDRFEAARAGVTERPGETQEGPLVWACGLRVHNEAPLDHLSSLPVLGQRQKVLLGPRTDVDTHIRRLGHQPSVCHLGNDRSVVVDTMASPSVVTASGAWRSHQDRRMPRPAVAGAPPSFPWRSPPGGAGKLTSERRPLRETVTGPTGPGQAKSRSLTG